MFFVPWIFAWQSCRVLVRTFAKTSSHPARKRDAGFPILFTKPVNRRQCLSPTPLSVTIKQADLRRLHFQRGRLHTQQSDLGSRTPVLPEKLSRFLENLVV